MTDHDWEGDGGAGGSAGAISGTADGRRGRPRSEKPGSPGHARSEKSGSRAANVVPFPGNWFGSVDELVPVHPEPRPPAGQSEPETPTVKIAPSIPEAWEPRVRIVPPAADPPADAEPMADVEATADAEVTAHAEVTEAAGLTADASAFWAGEASPLQEVIAAPVDSPPTLAEVPSVAAEPELEIDSSSVDSVSIPESPAPAAVDSEAQATRGRRGRWAPALAALVAAVAGGVLLVAHALPVGSTRGAGHVGGSLSARGRHKARALTQTVASPVTVTRTVEARDRPGRSSARTRHKAAGRGSNTAADAVGSDHAVDVANSQQTPASNHQSSASGKPTAASGHGSSPGTSTSASTGPPVAPKHSANSARSTSDCSTQSPDSGCLPNG